MHTFMLKTVTNHLHNVNKYVRKGIVVKLQTKTPLISYTCIYLTSVIIIDTSHLSFVYLLFHRSNMILSALVIIVSNCFIFFYTELFNKVFSVLKHAFICIFLYIFQHDLFHLPMFI